MATACCFVSGIQFFGGQAHLAIHSPGEGSSLALSLVGRQGLFDHLAAQVPLGRLGEANELMQTIVTQANRNLNAVGTGLSTQVADLKTVLDKLTDESTRAASQVAGRVLFAGYPTGVAVTAGQQHGGPFPSSTEPFTTSVGWAALDRFLRPVALQDAPAWLAARQGRPC